MRRHQAGITFIGWIVLLIPMVIVLYAAIRVAPFYLNHFKVRSVVDQVVAEHSGGSTVNAGAVRADIARRFDIEGISFPDPGDIEVVREGEQWVVAASYERSAPLFSGLQLLVVFDKRAAIQ